MNLSFNISFITNYLGTVNFKNEYIFKQKPEKNMSAVTLAVTTYKPLTGNIVHIIWRGRRGRDRMVVGFIIYVRN